MAHDWMWFSARFSLMSGNTQQRGVVRTSQPAGRRARWQIVFVGRAAVIWPASDRRLYCHQPPAPFVIASRHTPDIAALRDHLSTDKLGQPAGQVCSALSGMSVRVSCHVCLVDTRPVCFCPGLLHVQCTLFFPVRCCCHLAKFHRAIFLLIYISINNLPFTSQHWKRSGQVT